MFGKYTLPIILAIESILCVFIISYVSYTEIDWKAYMQEVAGFEMGERNYKELAGDTGPLVYPAGFLYIFYLLKKITNEGKDILRVQAIFGALYVFILFLTIRIYQVGAKMPAWTWFLLILSKRIHSIYVLRCFNDCFAVLFGFLAVLHFTKYKYKIGCVFYSLAVSIKMNMLLYAPGILLILLLGTSGIQETVVCLAICASIQLLLGAPFLLSFPVEYLSRAYDLTRKFDYQWTVNFKFLPEEYFLSPVLSIALLGSTIVAYGLFGRKWILESWKNVASRQKKALKLLGANDASYLIGIGRLSPHYIIVTIFVSNFVGIVFARTLHYQFYAWYWHMLPYLLWHAFLPNIVRILLLVAIEFAFNTYPATALSSAVLQIAHGAILVALYLTPAPTPFSEAKSSGGGSIKKLKIR